MPYTNPIMKDWVFSKKDLLEAVDKIEAKAKVNRDYDIPLLAGYSSDGSVIFIDRDCPKGYAERKGSWVNATPYLVLHEAVECALIAMWDIPYEPAHQIATRAEYEAVKAGGLNEKEYNGFMSQYIKKARSKSMYHVPKNLDMTCYKGEKSIIEKMTLT